MRLRILVALLAVALPVATGPRAADLAAGKAKAEGCAGCHGPLGISVTEMTPSLAGQPDEFTQWQLIFYRSGTRRNDVMGSIAEALSNEDVRDLAAYYASLPPPPDRPADDQPAMSDVGSRIAAVRHCGVCHMPGYAGAQAAARLAGQREDYLLKALRDFKSGARRGAGVATMAETVYPLDDPQLMALAHYLAHLR